MRLAVYRVTPWHDVILHQTLIANVIDQYLNPHNILQVQID